MQLTYDAFEDRMRLTLTQAHGQASVWLTRRQCVRLAAACLRAPSGEGEADRPARLSGTLPKRSAENIPGEASPGSAPELVKMVLGEADGATVVRLQLSDDRTIGFRLHAEQRKNLLGALRKLERKSCWDVLAAALNRSAAFEARKARMH